MKALTSTVAGNIVPAVSYTAGSYALTGLVVGKHYYYTMGANDTSIAFTSGATFVKTAAAAGIFTATATSATLAGSGTSAVGTTVSPILGVPLFAATVTPSLPARQVTVGQPTANPNFTRAIQVSDEYVFVKRGSYGVAIPLSDITNSALMTEVNLTWTPPVILSQPSAQTVAHGSQATIPISVASEYDLTYSWFELSPVTKTAATLSWSGSVLSYSKTTGLSTAVLTSNNTTPSDGDTVKISEKTYTLKTTLTPTEGEVLINGSADAALLNLIRAINHSGTPNTDYKCAAAHPSVTADTSVTAHAFAVTAKALSTTGIYDVATAGSLKITPTDTTLSGTYYYCTATDDAGSYGLANGSVTSATNQAKLTVT